MSSVNSTTRGSGFHADPDSGVCFRTLDFMGYSGFRVGDDGTVWTRWERGRWGRMRSTWVQLKSWPNTKSGHMVVGMKQKSHYVHRLVLLAFNGPEPIGMECRHFPDRTPANNSLKNLSWGTRKTNLADRIIHKTANWGERQGCHKLTDNVVREIRTEYATGKTTYLKLGNKHGVDFGTIYAVIKRKTWRHIK